MCTYLRTKTEVCMCTYLIDNFFFLTLTVRKKIIKKYECTELFPEKTEAVYAEQNKGEKAATSSYSAAVDF